MPHLALEGVGSGNLETVAVGCRCMRRLVLCLLISMTALAGCADTDPPCGLGLNACDGDEPVTSDTSGAVPQMSFSKRSDGVVVISTEDDVDWGGIGGGLSGECFGTLTTNGKQYAVGDPMAPPETWVEAGDTIKVSGTDGCTLELRQRSTGALLASWSFDF